HLALALFAQESAARILDADDLMPDRPLRSLHLIEVSGLESEPLLSRALTVDERMSDYLRGVNRIDARLHAVLDDVRPGLSADRVDHLASCVVQHLEAESGRWPVVNLVAASSSVARDVARRACEHLGLRCCSVDPARMAALPPDERALLIELMGREASLGGVAVVVDAAMVERSSGVAATIDELVTSLAGSLFLLSPERWPNDLPLHVMRVAELTRADQRVLWRTALQTHPNAVNGEVDAIVQQFDFSASAIGDIVERAAARSNGREIAPEELWQECRDETTGALDELARRIVPVYGWDDMVVSAEVAAQLHELANQVEQRSRVYETWGFGAQLERGRGITALFSGVSGTGKTMAAEILAAHLALDLYRIDLAGVVSKYIGETEKNLRRVFDAAERSGAILFFDEADALFGTRTEVRDSHDRYANVEVNYLLQRMEDYVGLAILATNRRAALDGAFLRRLRFVVEFQFPGVDDRRRIWERVFPGEAQLDAIDYSFLARLELTGGNIRSIAINAAFLASAEDAPIGMAHLARAAAREFTKLDKPISVADFGPYHAMAAP
ncbi:MAG: ATP-binding protein, partial [Polyangiales bacterium]